MQRAMPKITIALEALEVRGNAPLRILYSMRKILLVCLKLKSFMLAVGPHHRAITKAILDQAARHQLSPKITILKKHCPCGQAFCLVAHELKELNFLAPKIVVAKGKYLLQLASCPAEIY